MTNENELVFENDTPLSIPVKIGTGDYTLREATGDAAARYKNSLLRGVEFTDGKPTKAGCAGDGDAFLVSLCLFTVNGGPVSNSKVRSWPDRIVRVLAKKAKELSELEDEEEGEGSEAAKNEQEPSTDGLS